jgi:excisionase family DNA binding protein
VQTLFPFLTVNEAAAAMRMSRPTIYRRMAAGTIKFVTEGGRRMIPTSEIERYGAELVEAAAA